MIFEVNVESVKYHFNLHEHYGIRTSISKFLQLVVDE